MNNPFPRMQSSSSVAMFNPFGCDAVHHATVSHYIEQRYRQCYDADIACDYDSVLAVTGPRGEYLAAVGFRPPTESFFAEHYLDSAAEVCLSQCYRKPIDRFCIAEVGNLVASDGQAAFALMQHLWTQLGMRAYRYILITCTRQIRRRFRQLPLVYLASAEANRVPRSDNWGRYYENRPEVNAAELARYDQRFGRFVKRRDLALHCIEREVL